MTELPGLDNDSCIAAISIGDASKREQITAFRAMRKELLATQEQLNIEREIANDLTSQKLHDSMLLAGVKSHRIKKDKEPIGYALQWPGKPVNMHTTFNTEGEAQVYVVHLGDEKPSVVPLCIY